MNKNDNSGLIRIVLIIMLSTVLIIGNTEIKDDKISLTRLNKDEISGNLRGFVTDFTTFNKGYKKVNAMQLNKEIKTHLIPGIERAQEQLAQNQAKEKMLQREIDDIPTSDYIHSKMELSSFMVEKLREQELVYEIDYNYEGKEGRKRLEVKEIPEEEEVEEEEETEEDAEEEIEEEEEVIVYKNKFKITVYQINEDDNYTKLNSVLEDIFIKEPYEISGIKMEYNELTKGYTLSFIVEV